MTRPVASTQAGAPDYILLAQPRIQIVRSSPTGHFTDQLTKGQSERENLTLLTNKVVIERLGLQSAQPLFYRLHVFARDAFTNSDLARDTFLSSVDLDLSRYGRYLNNLASLDKFQSYIGAVPTAQTSSVGLSGGDNIWQAQSFRHTSDYTLERLNLRLSRVGGTSPGIMTVSIRRATDAGDPTGSDLVSATVNVDSISTTVFTGELVTVDLDPTAIWAGQEYAIVVRIPAGNTGLRWLSATSDPYSLGRRAQSLDGVRPGRGIPIRTATLRPGAGWTPPTT